MAWHQQIPGLIVFPYTREVTVHILVPEHSPESSEGLAFTAGDWGLRSKIKDVSQRAGICFPLSLTHLWCPRISWLVPPLGVVRMEN